MTDKISILVLSNIETKEKLIFVKMLQEFSLSLIFYLFYAAELLKTCNSINDQLNTSIFVNNIILLIYEQITKENCRILENTHN